MVKNLKLSQPLPNLYHLSNKNANIPTRRDYKKDIFVETLFNHDKRIVDLHLCRDGKTLTYNMDNQVFYRKIGSPEKNLGTGAGLRMLDNSRFVFSNAGVLSIVDIDGAVSIVKAKGDLVKNLLKASVRSPSPNKAGTKVAGGIGKITRPKTWGEREYCGIVDLEKSTFEILDFETFGGNPQYFPTSGKDIIFLCAMEIKGGQLHIIDLDSNESYQFIGMAPAISPLGDMIAYRKEGSITIVKTDGSQWKLTDRKSHPDDGMGQNYNPPVWIDNKTIIYDSKDIIYRFDIEKNNAKKVAELPGLVVRRTNTIVGPYYDGIIAISKEQDTESAVLIKY